MRHTSLWAQLQAQRCFCLLLATAILFSSHAHALYCVQCESTDDDLCRIGLVPPTKCTTKGAMACVTMVGKYPGSESYIRRACTSRPKGSFCTRLEPIPNMVHDLCLKTCFEEGCNMRPAIDIRF